MLDDDWGDEIDFAALEEAALKERERAAKTALSKPPPEKKKQTNPNAIVSSPTGKKTNPSYANPATMTRINSGSSKSTDESRANPYANVSSPTKKKTNPYAPPSPSRKKTNPYANPVVKPQFNSKSSNLNNTSSTSSDKNSIIGSRSGQAFISVAKNHLLRA